jgi:tetratricopeptide (TPR) repeat protein
MRRESRRVILFIDRSQQQKVAHLISQMQQAQILHREGRLDDARTLCEDLLREVPGRFEALSLLALIAAQQGDFERAIVGYDRVGARRSPR